MVATHDNSQISDEDFLQAVNSTLETFKDPFAHMDSSTAFPLVDNVGDKTGNQLSKVSEEVARMFTLVITIGVCAGLSVFGVASNVVNIIVFVKQGFQDTVNVSLCAISVSDLFSAITLLWLTVCHNPLFVNADIPFLSMEIEVLTSGIPHSIAMNATGLLTAFVAFERCLCVVYPLKIKDMITRGRTIFFVVLSFVLAIGGHITAYYTLRLGWRFVPERNRTMLGIYTIEGSDEIEEISFYIFNVFGPLLTFLAVLTCSIILIIQLNQKSKWRQSISSTGKHDDQKAVTLTSRDWKVVKMVAIVAVVFVISFTPYVMISVVMASEPKFRFYGEYRAAFTICVSIGSFLEAINASSNIFIYYQMSSKFKGIFRTMFCGGSDNKNVSQTKSTSSKTHISRTS